MSKIFWGGPAPGPPLGCLTPSALVCMTSQTTLASPLSIVGGHTNKYANPSYFVDTMNLISNHSIHRQAE
jgi:hypothetical protein